MPLAERIQWLIHKLEVGAGSHYLRYFALVIGVVGLAFIYDLRAYRNLAAPEAMDAAQLARNLSEGRGYTTLFLRPFSLYLVQKHATAKNPATGTNAPTDAARIKASHPDISNPPVYPLVLAGLMKVLPFDYGVNLKSPFWANEGNMRYQPDFLIALLNQTLLLIIVGLTFIVAKRLFDSSVAWLSGFLVLGSELLWRFSVSGLSTLLLLAVFMGSILMLVEIERGGREAEPRSGWLMGLAAGVGILTGIGALTRYAFGWAIIPVAVFLVLFSGSRRVGCMFAALLAFVLVLTPWIIRNETVSGTPFGTAGYAVVEGAGFFQEFRLERSLHPELSQAMRIQPYGHKLLVNFRGIFNSDLLKSGASWSGMLFFASLFMAFRSVGTRRIRYFLLMCLAVFSLAQALGRTQLSEVSPEINSENLLVLLVPLVVIFGAGFFVTMLEQMTLPIAALRYLVTVGFVALCWLSLCFTLSSSRSSPVVYPPYYPPEIQKAANWMKPNELMMSDVPWAIAWYGQRQCVWLTLDAQDDFFAINDYLKPVQALYLTPQTMDGKFVTEWMEAGASSWGRFLFQTVTDKHVPSKFPLTVARTDFFPERLFLTDRDRWSTVN